MVKKNFFQKVKCFFRKWLSAKVIPHMILNSSRVFFYRLCGYKIGKNVFIGMRCYFDDLEPKMFTIEDNVTISYGCFFACHGKKQKHCPITIKEGAYIGMHASIISKNTKGENLGITIGKNAIIGACTLVNIDIPENATAVGVPCKVIKENE